MKSKALDYRHTPAGESKESDSTNRGAVPSLIESRSMSIVIPTLNEEANIANLLDRLDRTLKEANITYEAIVVDDHSTDGTFAVAEAAAREKHLPIRALLKQGQPGKAFSLIEGFGVAHFDVLAMIDGDLQYPPEVLPVMEQRLADADIVVADRRTSYSGCDRRRGKLSAIFLFILYLLFGIDVDMQSGLKLFRREVYREVYKDSTLTPGPWGFGLDFITQAVHKGYVVTNVPITFQQRSGGTSKMRLLSVGAELLTEAIRLKIAFALHTLTNRLPPLGTGTHGKISRLVLTSLNATIKRIVL